MRKLALMFPHCELWKIVVNIEDQYSVWPEGKEMPYGWREEGKSGSKEECLKHIEEIWTDMRPRSLKEAMIEKEKNAA